MAGIAAIKGTARWFEPDYAVQVLPAEEARQRMGLPTPSEEFAKLHPDLNKLPEPARAELKLLRDEQNRVLELFRELTTDAKAPGGNP